MTFRSTARPVRVFQPINRLTILADRPGGMLRAMAIGRAERRLADQRLPAMKAMVIFITTLGDMATSGAPLLDGELPAIRRIAGQLVTLALTYELDALADVGMKLCDLIAAFAQGGRAAREPIAVFVRALRLFAPGAGPPPEAMAATVLSELDRLLAHFGAVPPDAMEF